MPDPVSPTRIIVLCFLRLERNSCPTNDREERMEEMGGKGFNRFAGSGGGDYVFELVHGQLLARSKDLPIASRVRLKGVRVDVRVLVRLLGTA